MPTDLATGRPVPQLGVAEVKTMWPEEIVAADKAGTLTASAPSHDVSPPPPEVSAPAPVRAGFQFQKGHVELMDNEAIARYRAAGQLYDYGQVRAAGEC
ncbi:hypothetical protein [Streptomyces arboris]|uniref:hypothetical protein n=1 Tax=Streptomyces arboris TaxID=2600619 RepID=UPI003C30CF39